jgi:hypothetical protein
VAAAIEPAPYFAGLDGRPPTPRSGDGWSGVGRPARGGLRTPQGASPHSPLPGSFVALFGKRAQPFKSAVSVIPDAPPRGARGRFPKASFVVRAGERLFECIRTDILHEALYEAKWGCAEARRKHERLYGAAPRHTRSIRSIRSSVEEDGDERCRRRKVRGHKEGKRAARGVARGGRRRCCACAGPGGGRHLRGDGRVTRPRGALET